jgi:hypothetical protein
MRARSARSAVLAGAFALALATGGLAYGSSAGDDGVSTTGAQTAKAASGAAPARGTAAMHAKQGVKPSKTIPKGSTRTTRPPADRNVAPKRVDKSDRGVKGAKATKDLGQKNAASTRDRGAR